MFLAPLGNSQTLSRCEFPPLLVAGAGTKKAKAIDIKQEEEELQPARLERIGG